ncbi:MAG: hypothetical protein ABII90_09070, partial [Bacteroidota bacterium]
MKRIILLLILITCSYSVFAQIKAVNKSKFKPTQEKCGTMEYLEMLKAQDPGLEQRMQAIEAHTQKIIQKQLKDPSKAKRA